MPDSTPNQLFDQALAFQQQKDWDQALLTYEKLLDQSTDALNASQASVIYHNLSTIAYEKADLLKAYIWSKKAVSLDPSNSLAQEAFAIYSKKFEIPVIAHQITTYDSLKKIVSYGPIDLYLILSVILLASTLFLFFKNILLSRKKQLSEDYSPVTKWPVIFLLILTLIMISAASIKYTDVSMTKALILADKTQIQTAPGENKPVIFEAPAGLQVEVLNEENGFFQVRYVGAFSGWAKKTQLEILSLSFEQK